MYYYRLQPAILIFIEIIKLENLKKEKVQNEQRDKILVDLTLDESSNDALVPLKADQENVRNQLEAINEPVPEFSCKKPITGPRDASTSQPHDAMIEKNPSQVESTSAKNSCQDLQPINEPEPEFTTSKKPITVPSDASTCQPHDAIVENNLSLVESTSARNSCQDLQATNEPVPELSSQKPITVPSDASTCHPQDTMVEKKPSRVESTTASNSCQELQSDMEANENAELHIFGEKKPDASNTVHDGTERVTSCKVLQSSSQPIAWTEAERRTAHAAMFRCSLNGASVIQICREASNDFVCRKMN